jgi:hypothetical protein
MNSFCTQLTILLKTISLAAEHMKRLRAIPETNRQEFDREVRTINATAENERGILPALMAELELKQRKLRMYTRLDVVATLASQRLTGEFADTFAKKLKDIHKVVAPIHDEVAKAKGGAERLSVSPEISTRGRGAGGEGGGNSEDDVDDVDGGEEDGADDVDVIKEEDADDMDGGEEEDDVDEQYLKALAMEFVRDIVDFVKSKDR